MKNMTDFNDFLESYTKLKDGFDKGLKFFIESYHHDANGEPFSYVGCYPERVKLEYIKDHGFLILIITPETVFTFSEKKYTTNVSGRIVAFGSKHDDETHSLIEIG